jgi:hypothetical protein
MSSFVALCTGALEAPFCLLGRMLRISQETSENKAQLHCQTIPALARLSARGGVPDAETADRAVNLAAGHGKT